MKKLVVVLLVLVSLLGCSKKEPEPVTPEETYEEKINKIVSELDGSKYYFYRQLNDQQRFYYAQLEDALANGKDELEFTDKDNRPVIKEFYKAQVAFEYDHPLYWWLHDSVGDTIGTKIKKVTYNGRPEESVLKQINDKVDEVIAGMPAGLSEVQKFEYLYEWVILNTRYELDSEFNQDVRSVFLNGVSVCNGYAKAYQLLCQRAGLECGYNHGISSRPDWESGFHAWNFVRIADRYYWVDSTWGDEADETLPYDYSWFCMTDEEFFQTRVADSGINVFGYGEPNGAYKLPESTDHSMNHFVRNGSYFETADKDAIKAYITRALENNEYIELQFADADTMAKGYKYLTDNFIKIATSVLGSNQKGKWVMYQLRLTNCVLIGKAH